MKPREPFTRDVLVNIEAGLQDMPGALSRIGTYILAEPESTVRASMAELAETTGAGEASIVRFCKQLGFEGFRDFKIALTSEIAYARGSQVQGTSELADRIVGALYSTSEAISEDLLRVVAKRLLAARHVDVFGSGVSGFVADIYAYRLSRLGLVARAYQDPVIVGEVAAGIGPDSAFIAISETGLTVHTQRFLEMARAQGAYTVAVSGRQLSQLSELCDALLLATRLSPHPERGETTAAIAKIFVCELLARRIQLLQEEAG